MAAGATGGHIFPVIAVAEELELASLAATLGFQVFIIVGGVVGLFPLTGVTLPFVSYGGSSLVANFLLVALAWSIGTERREPAAEREALGSR